MHDSSPSNDSNEQIIVCPQSLPIEKLFLDISPFLEGVNGTFSKEREPHYQIETALDSIRANHVKECVECLKQVEALTTYLVLFYNKKAMQSLQCSTALSGNEAHSLLDKALLVTSKPCEFLPCERKRRGLLGVTLNNLALVLKGEGKYFEALKTIKKAISVEKKSGRDVNMAMTYLNAYYVANLLSRNSVAKDFVESAWREWSRWEKGESINELGVMILFNAVTACEVLGKKEEAYEYAKIAVERWKGGEEEWNEEKNKERQGNNIVEEVGKEMEYLQSYVSHYLERIRNVRKKEMKEIN